MSAAEHPSCGPDAEARLGRGRSSWAFVNRVFAGFRCLLHDSLPEVGCQLFGRAFLGSVHLGLVYFRSAKDRWDPVLGRPFMDLAGSFETNRYFRLTEGLPVHVGC